MQTKQISLRMNEHNEQAQALAAIRAEIIRTLTHYLKCFENANVQCSLARKIEVITELYEYILRNINCRIYLLDPEKDHLFNIMERQVGEFMANPKAQADHRFMTACQAIDVFFRNGRILKAEQAAQAAQAAQAQPPPPAPAPVPIVLAYDDLHAEQDEHDANFIDGYDTDYDEDDDDEDDYDDEGVGRGVAELGHREVPVPVAAVAQPAPVVREVMHDYFNRIIAAAADLQQKVDLTVELFAWLNARDDIQYDLLAPENADLFAGLDGLLHDLEHNPFHAAAVQANADYATIHADIQYFIAEGRQQIQEIQNPFLAAAAQHCRGCEEFLFEHAEGLAGYCRACAMCKFGREHSMQL